MGTYNYEHFVRDFIYRTRINKNIIQHRYEENPKKKYEVTQLINSLFGLIIVPNEKYKFKRNEEITKEETLEIISEDEYNNILEFIEEIKDSGKYYNTYEDKYPVSDFIKHLRNSLAHSGEHGLHFVPLSEAQEITGVIFYDTDRYHNHEFCVELTISEIIDLSEIISDMYSKVDEKNAEKNRKEYEEEIERLRALFKNKGN